MSYPSFTCRNSTHIKHVYNVPLSSVCSGYNSDFFLSESGQFIYNEVEKNNSNCAAYCTESPQCGTSSGDCHSCSVCVSSKLSLRSSSVIALQIVLFLVVIMQSFIEIRTIITYFNGRKSLSEHFKV